MDLNGGEFEKFIKENEKCVVDFWAPWCAPCLVLSPNLEMACAEKGVLLGKVNIDEEKELANEYEIMSIPCMIKFENGKPVDRRIGNISKESIIQFLG